MSHRPRLLPVLVLALVSAWIPACGGDKGESGTKAEGGKVEAGKAPSTSGTKPADPTPVAETAAAAGGVGETETGDDEPVEQLPIPATFEQIGVPACDDYVKTYVACIDTKVPEADREAQRRIVFDNVTSWKQTASGGEAATKGLQTGCKIATELAKRETQAWDCGW